MSCEFIEDYRHTIKYIYQIVMHNATDTLNLCYNKQLGRIHFSILAYLTGMTENYSINDQLKALSSTSKHSLQEQLSIIFQEERIDMVCKDYIEQKSIRHKTNKTTRIVTTLHNIIKSAFVDKIPECISKYIAYSNQL